MTADAQLIAGYATPEGTARFRDRFGNLLPGHFRRTGGLWLSSIGLGTYLGDPTDAYDALSRSAITRAIELGTNVLDTAANYRHQRSERTIGEVLRQMISAGSIQRDEILVATKGGFLSFDRDEPRDPAAYFEEKFVQTGIVRPDEVAAGCHVMSPGYLENQIETSRTNLGLETIDLYYLHNPETQFSQVSRPDFYRRLKAAFAQLEKAVTDGHIRAYGTATWNAYRAGPQARDAISLADVLRAAEEAGGKGHHFRALQLPFNLAMTEALTSNAQTMQGRQVPVLQMAQAHGLMAFASASLLQGQLASGIPLEIQGHFSGLDTDAQRAIQFARSAPGITGALVGMGRVEHVEENMGTARVQPLAFQQFRALFGSSTGTEGGRQ
jgi:aryl-alcohol dehydrogenase-like predicted oxidoreductase